MKRTYLLPVMGMTLLLAGCVNIGASKQVVVPVQNPNRNIVVSSVATVHCRDFIVFFKCNIDIDSKTI
jgi:uncharacterized lipoprotein YajG